MKINQPQYIIDEQGKKTAVILDLKAFNKLLEELEDLYDIVEAEKIIKSGGKTFTTHEVEKACSSLWTKKQAVKKRLK